MILLQPGNFPDQVRSLTIALLDASTVDVGEWHAQSTNGNPMLVTREMQDVALEIPVPQQIDTLQYQVNPNLPWAESHFQERVGGKPLNPPPSHADWPWAHDQHQDADAKFSHTYPERYWPREAGDYVSRELGRQRYHLGIRYQYGDLSDLVELLRRNGNTRQAYLPVWFPEDLNAAKVHKARVPCSLGYHFLIREGKLSCRYYLRSCDFVRHFRDDVYMTARLVQWVAEQIPGVVPGKLIMYISSLHIMAGDEFKLKKELADGE